jgi:hypothetical protein
MPDVSTHPTSQQLALFGHGKLPEAQATAIAAHLETCAECRQAVANLPPDSFFDKVRGARTSATVPPASAQAAEALRDAVSGPAAADVPPQLADHPKFRILRELGRGGMGVIYLAEHRVMDKPVALKVISRSVLDNPDAVARFLGEVRAAGKLDHPNIARAHDADQAGELHFLVMEYVEGMSLAQLLQKKGPLSVASACHCVCQAALGLQHAFEKGMAHRDVKPQNLMLTPKGQVKVLDFGLARLRGPQAVGKGLTQADAFMGTPEYVSPEQATDARQADIRADIYSLGCTLYALLTGRPPFVEDTMVKLVMAHIEKEPPPLHELRPDVPAEVAAVAAKMLAKDPARRYQRPIEVAQALAPFAKSGAQARATGVAPPAEKSAGTGTVMGGDTSRVLDPVEKAPKLAANKPAGSEPAPSGDPEWTRHPPAPLPVKRLKKRREAPAPAPWWKRPAVLIGGGAGVVLLLVVVLWAAGVLRVKTKDGTIVLEDLPPDAEVLVDGDTATVTWGADGKKAEVRIKPGGHEVEVRKEGIKVLGQKVIVEDGDRKVLTVRLEPRPAGPPPDSPAPPAPAGKPDRPKADYDALATGRWVPILAATGESVVSKGALFKGGILEVKDGKAVDRAVQGKDMIVRAKVKKVSGRNVALLARQNTSNPLDGNRYAAWFIDNNRFGVGKIESGKWTNLREQSVPEQAKVRDGEFFEFAFAVVGGTLTVYVNGKRILEVRDEAVLPGLGAAGVATDWCVGQFKDIEVQVLQPAAKPAPPESTGFHPLFNGKDLTGWKTHPDQPAKWVVENGVLISRGAGGNLLFSERGDYENFHLRAEVRVNQNGNSGVFFHRDFSAKAVDAYEVDICTNQTGSLFEYPGGILTVHKGVRNAIKDPYEWFTLELIVEGDHVTVLLNGQKAVDHKLPAGYRKRGHIALQQNSSWTVAEFRKVEIKELK